MSQIVLKANDDPKVLGHLFCDECATELLVVMDDWNIFLNRNYKKDWDLTWHEFHNVKWISPDLIKAFHDRDFDFECPYCSCDHIDKLTYLENGMLDPRLILRSFKSDNAYTCDRCENTYANGKCVIKVGRETICSDCAPFI
jgi:hypothetical protein